MRVLALDPGERVGWARADVNEAGLWLDFEHGITELRPMAIALHANIAKYDVVVMESWRLYPHMARQFIGSSFPSVQFVGMVRLLTWIHPTVKLVMQGASIKKQADKTMQARSPELLERVTASRAHDDAHDMDAIRHLWHWTWKNYPIHKEMAA